MLPLAQFGLVGGVPARTGQGGSELFSTSLRGLLCRQGLGFMDRHKALFPNALKECLEALLARGPCRPPTKGRRPLYGLAFWVFRLGSGVLSFGWFCISGFEFWGFGCCADGDLPLIPSSWNPGVQEISTDSMDPVSKLL